VSDWSVLLQSVVVVRCCKALLQCVLHRCCSVLQLRHSSTGCVCASYGVEGMLQCVAVRCCSVLQCVVTVCCSGALPPSHAATPHGLCACIAQGVSDCSVMQCVVAVWCCSVLQRGALSAERVRLQCDAVRCCSVSQCVTAVCCSVLKRGALSVGRQEVCAQSYTDVYNTKHGHAIMCCKLRYPIHTRGQRL